jgi:hypothetical protein
VASRLIDRRGADARAEEALARRAADDLHAEYATSFNGLAHGTVGPDGASVPGWDALTYEALDTEDGGAHKRVSKAQQAFLQSEKYTALSPRAKVLFDSRSQSTYSVMAEEAVKLDARNRLEGRKLKDEANLSASLAAADAVPLDDDDAWSRAAAKSAADAAVMRMGTEIVNPEDLYAGGEPDPARLRFRGGEPMRAIYAAEAAKTRDSLTSARAARMINAARAENDLDRQESFLASAARFAQERVADEKTRAAVTTDAERIRAHALEKEKLTAWDALATGKPYAYEGSARREAAYREVMPKLEERRRTEQNRTLTGNKEFLAAMAKAGARVDADGRVVAMTTDESREWLRAQLAAGNIRAKDYGTITTGLDKIEKSGQKARYERVAAEVTAALGTEVQTLWTDAGAALKDKEDPARKIGSYTFEETRRELVPETESVTAYRGGAGFGLPATQSRPTGRTVERVTAVRRKRELFASDVAKVIDLLMEAEGADGLRLDLDGNPMTPDKPFDARAYRTRLLTDIKNRQLAVDLDTQAATLAGAVSLYRRDQRMLEASAVLKNAALKLPNDTTTPREEPDHAD